jgi:hypothetical protein
MPSILYDVERWREYAKQMRALSRTISHPPIKQQTIAAAAGFDRIAYLASKLQSTSEQRPKRQRWGGAA